MKTLSIICTVIALGLFFVTLEPAFADKEELPEITRPILRKYLKPLRKLLECIPDQYKDIYKSYPDKLSYDRYILNDSGLWERNVLVGKSEVKMTFVLIPVHSSEIPHCSILSELDETHFWINKYEVTNDQFIEFINDNNDDDDDDDDERIKKWIKRNQDIIDKTDDNLPLKIKKRDKNLPVIYISWTMANKFAEWSNKFLTGNEKCSLPTESQWKYVCMGGINCSELGFDNNIKLLNKKFVNCYNNEKPDLIEVGSLKHPNLFGIHDMIGNVREWCKTRNASPFKIKQCGGSLEYIINDSKCIHCGGPINMDEKDFDGDNDVGFRLVINVLNN